MAKNKFIGTNDRRRQKVMDFQCARARVARGQMFHLGSNRLPDVAAIQNVARQQKSLLRKQPELECAGASSGGIRRNQLGGNRHLAGGIEGDLQPIVASERTLRKGGERRPENGKV